MERLNPEMAKGLERKSVAEYETRIVFRSKTPKRKTANTVMQNVGSAMSAVMATQARNPGN